MSARSTSYDEKETVWTFRMDDMLRQIVYNCDSKDLKKAKKWEEIAKSVPGTTARECQARWYSIRSLPGLEYKSILSAPVKSESTRKLSAKSKWSSSRNNNHSERERSGSNSQLTARSNDTEPTKDTTTSPKESKSSDKEDDRDDVIIIHVCDENRKINRDFECTRKLLLSQMKYFKTYLCGSNFYDDIDISVHCDVNIFQWLMNHLNHPDKPPKLEVSNVVSILISSDFLQMEALVGKCIEFFYEHVNEIVKMPIDLNCLNNMLVTKLAKLFQPEELEGIKDRKDKLTSKLYMKKLEEMFDDDDNALYKCAFCNKLFAAKQREWMICPKAKIFIDYHGNVIAEHVANRAWDVNKYLMYLRSQKMTWREIFWKLWGKVHAAKCTTCKSTFVLSDLGHCSFHASEPKFLDGENNGAYPCCGTPALRFDTSTPSKTGCMARPHTTGKRDAQVVAIAQRFSDCVLRPFKADEDEEEGVELDGSEIEDETDEDETDDDSEFSSDDSDRQQNSKTNKSSKRSAQAKRRRKKTRVSTDKTLTPKKKRIWRQDIQREEDHKRMLEMLSQLGTKRGDAALQAEREAEREREKEKERDKERRLSSRPSTAASFGRRGSRLTSPSPVPRMPSGLFRR